jgi:hypothetical protein
LKPLSNGCLGIIIKINLTTNYQLLLNCNKVHRAGNLLRRIWMNVSAIISQVRKNGTPCTINSQKPK